MNRHAIKNTYSILTWVYRSLITEKRSQKTRGHPNSLYDSTVKDKFNRFLLNLRILFKHWLIYVVTLFYLQCRNIELILFLFFFVEPNFRFAVRAWTVNGREILANEGKWREMWHALWEIDEKMGWKRAAFELPGQSGFLSSRLGSDDIAS